MMKSNYLSNFFILQILKFLWNLPDFDDAKKRKTFGINQTAFSVFTFKIGYVDL